MSEASNPLFADQTTLPPAVETQMIPGRPISIPLDAQPIGPAEQFGISDEIQGHVGKVDVIGQFSMGKQVGLNGTGVPLFLVRRPNPLDTQGIHFDYHILGGKQGADGKVLVDTDGEWGTPLGSFPGDKEVVIGRSAKPIEGLNEYGEESVKLPIESISMNILSGQSDRVSQVSRAHLGVRYRWGHGITVRDLGSSNGTVQIEYPAEHLAEPAQGEARVLSEGAPRPGVTDVGRVVSERLIDVSDVPSPVRAEQESLGGGAGREQILSRIAALTDEINQDPAIGQVEYAKRAILEIRQDMQENWADARRRPDEQIFQNHGQESGRLQQRMAEYEGDLRDMKNDGRYARYEADSRVTERLALRNQLKAN